MQTRDDIFNTCDALVELFELEPERVTLNAALYQDLEIDSIDAVVDPHQAQNRQADCAKEIQIGAERNDGQAVYRLVHADA